MVSRGTVQIGDIHPLTDFKRRTTEFRDRLKKTGQPEVLTVEGRPAIVVQDAAAYQRMMELVDRAETIEGIRAELESLEAGRGITLEEFDAKMRRKHKSLRRPKNR